MTRTTQKEITTSVEGDANVVNTDAVKTDAVRLTTTSPLKTDDSLRTDSINSKGIYS